MEWVNVKVRFSNRKVYQVSIKRIYKGSGLWKFEVSGGEKKVILEKHLYRKTNKWMMPVGGLNEADVKILANYIEFLIENPTGVKPKEPHPKNGFDWSKSNGK